MIGRDTGGGSSFAGAGLYYLHDRNADTDERVAFTHTENLLTDNPETAMKVMAWTAMHQKELKAAAGVKATGRKLEKPVHTFVLSWAPGEDPDHEHMIETARSAMGALGLADHEAVYVGHDDTDKAHVHVIVNRVHPDHGKAAKLSKTRLKLSKWAEAYEKEHGIHCHQRIENNKRRAFGNRVIDLKSRRRNAEHFSDWREKRREEAVSVREKRRFQDWADRKQQQQKNAKEANRKRVENRLSAKRALIETRLSRTFDTAPQEARLEALEVSLSVGGVKAVWRRISGRRKREILSKDEIEKSISAIKHKHQRALHKVREKLFAERLQFLGEEREKTQALNLRVENARARREREGWKSFKADRPRQFVNDNQRNPQELLDNAAARKIAALHSRGPEIER